jgi:hypothetical protein
MDGRVCLAEVSSDVAWRFRKSIPFGKLGRINLSRSGVGFSVGVRGMRISLGADGKVRRTTSIPGTGLRKTEVLGSVDKKKPAVVCSSCGRGAAKSDRFCRHCGQRQ